MTDSIKHLMKIAEKYGFDPFINSNEELILCRKTNLWFRIDDVTSLWSDVSCKLLEWCSRDAYKSMRFASEKRNKRYHKDVRNIINEFLGTSFDEDDMQLIYSELGNGVNHDLTFKFVRSGFNMDVLKK